MPPLGGRLAGERVAPIRACLIALQVRAQPEPCGASEAAGYCYRARVALRRAIAIVQPHRAATSLHDEPAVRRAAT